MNVPPTHARDDGLRCRRIVSRRATRDSHVRQSADGREARPRCYGRLLAVCAAFAMAAPGGRAAGQAAVKPEAEPSVQTLPAAPATPGTAEDGPAPATAPGPTSPSSGARPTTGSADPATAGAVPGVEPGAATAPTTSTAGTQPATTTAPTTGPATTTATAPSTGPATTTATAPSTGPATTQSAGSGGGGTVAPSLPFPREFGALLTRSVFARGKPPSPSGGANAGASGPEANLGLRGVGLQDGQFMAMIEDVNAKSVLRLKAGESVAFGKIKTIDLDSIVYESAGKSTKVTVGQNLLGAPLPAPKPPQTQPAAAPADGAPGGPPQPGAPGQPGQPGGPQPVRGRRGPQ